MKNKKTVFNICVYIGILAVIVITFVAVTTMRASGNYVDVYVLNQELSAGTEITSTTFARYFTTTKVSSDTEELAKDYNTTVVKNSQDVVGNYTIGYIPAGTILYANMFTSVQANPNNLYGLVNEYTSPQYITLNASNIYAPANGFNAHTNINIANVNAYTILEESTGLTRELYGILVNKTEVYTIMRDGNNEITNVGMVMEAEDAKMLTTMQDKGITFRYIEDTHLELATWTTDDITSSLDVSTANGEDSYITITKIDGTSSFIPFSQSKFSEAEALKNIPTYNLATYNSLEFYVEGRQSNLSVRKYGLDGGIESIECAESTIANGKLSYESQRKITKINYTFNSRGLYQITPAGAKYSYYFILENEADATYTTVNENFAMTVTSLNEQNTTYQILNELSTQSKYTKKYYSTCVPLANAKYYETFEFSDDFMAQYLGDGTTPTLSRVKFLVDDDFEIGTYKGKEIDNIYFATSDNSNATAMPMFFKINPTEIGSKTTLNNLTWTITDSLDQKTTYTGSDVFGFETTTNYVDSDVIKLHQMYSAEIKTSQISSESVLRGWLYYALTGRASADFVANAKDVNLTIVTKDNNKYSIKLNIFA